MTAYFDDFSDRLRDWRAWDRATVADRLREIEGQIYDDVCLCCAQSDFPADLRAGAYEIFLKYGVSILPECAEPADFEEDADYVERVRRMVSDLHSVFHEVAHRGIFLIGDSPEHWRQRICNGPRRELEVLAETHRFGPVRATAEARGWKLEQKEGFSWELAWRDSQGKDVVVMNPDSGKWVVGDSEFQYEGEALAFALRKIER